MNKTRSNKLYNYLVNNFGLSEEKVLQYVKDRIEEIIAKQVEHKLLDSNYVQNLILNRITQFLTEGVNTGHFYKRESFDDYLKGCIKQVIERKLNEEYVLEVKMVRKDKQVIGKWP
jgi:hypothetical protein